MTEYPRYEIGARVLLQNLTDEEEDLNGLAGEVVELVPLDVPNPKTGEEVRGWLHKVRLDDAEHSAQAGGFMDSRVFYRFQLLELPKEPA